MLKDLRLLGLGKINSLDCQTVVQSGSPTKDTEPTLCRWDAKCSIRSFLPSSLTLSGFMCFFCVIGHETSIKNRVCPYLTFVFISGVIYLMFRGLIFKHSSVEMCSTDSEWFYRSDDLHTDGGDCCFHIPPFPCFESILNPYIHPKQISSLTCP